MFGLKTPGKLDKVLIIPYKDEKYSQQEGEGYKVNINPETFTEKLEMEFGEDESAGTEGGELKFKRIKPQTIDLNLLFDSTGVIRNETSFGTNLFADEEITPVPDQILEFKKTVSDYNSEKHEPRFVKIVWGKMPFVFKGRLTALEIVYKLFKPDGTPIRATAKATFKSSIDKETEEQKKKKSSPDLTHIRVVKQGDTLPLMTYNIYGSSKYYLEVARVNQLNDFRNLTPGTSIYFPPLDKTS